MNQNIKKLKKMLTPPGGCPSCPICDSELLNLIKGHGDLRAAAYAACIRLSESTAVRFSGGTAPEQSGYWLRLARLYRPDYSGHIGRADGA